MHAVTKKKTHTKKRLSSFCHLQDKKNSWQENKNLTPVLWITFVSRFFFVRKNGCGWRRFLRARRRTLFITSFREKSFLDWLMEQHLNDYKSNSNILWQILFTHFSVRFFSINKQVCQIFFLECKYSRWLTQFYSIFFYFLNEIFVSICVNEVFEIFWRSWSFGCLLLSS